MTDLIDILLKELRQRRSDALVFNQYDGFEYQIFNLKAYLEYHYEQRAGILLLGEASGYNGCRWCGIPFTSGYILAKDRIYASIRRRFHFAHIQDKKELSASIVHSFFNKYPDLFPDIVLHNAFPFHPHKENQPETNRKPKKEETEEGKKYLIKLFDIFRFREYYAIGKVAEKMLLELQQDKQIFKFKRFRTIRHPSFGGANQFRQDLMDIFGLKEKSVQKTLF